MQTMGKRPKPHSFTAIPSAFPSLRCQTAVFSTIIEAGARTLHAALATAKRLVKYKLVMKKFPKAKTLDRTIDSWLRQWQIMIGNQFDQEGDQVRGKKWLSDLALKFENTWPFLAQKVLDISDKVGSRSPEERGFG